MRDPRSPHIVRPTAPAYYAKPGLHSHNASRRKREVSSSSGAIRGIQLLLLILGIAGIGYYAYTLCDQYVYQAYANWAFDQEIAGHGQVTFADYIRARTPFGFLVGPAPTATPTANSPAQAQNSAPLIPKLAEGTILGRVDIARLNLSAMVREGVDAGVLKVAVGHVPSTALPGQPGNFAIAAHRDTLFRALKDIRLGDLVSFQSPAGTYTYKVVATKIVRPTDVSVLQPNGGGLIPPTRLVANNGQASKLLTMITCYPFYYVGSAPKRFIVEAELVENSSNKLRQPNEVSRMRAGGPNYRSDPQLPLPRGRAMACYTALEPLGGRLMVRLQTLDLRIGVRVPASQPLSPKHLL